MASAPNSSTTSIGSMPFPSDLDMRRPIWSLTVPLMRTSVKGRSPMNSYPAITMRATQKNRISDAVTSVLPG